MANKTVYVDGTTSSGHYATLQAMVTGEVTTLGKGDLTAADYNGGGPGILNVEISIEGADTATCVINGFTTSADYYVNIYTTAAARHAGVWDDNKYHLYISNNYGLSITDQYVRLTGLQIANHSPSDNNKSVLSLSTTGAATFWISQCLLRGHGSATYTQTGCVANIASATLCFWDNIIYGIAAVTGNKGFEFAGTGATGNVYNCTIISGDIGLSRFSGTLNAKNCYCTGTNPYSGTIGTSYCASSEASELSGTGDITSAVPYNTTTFISVTPATDGTGDYLKPKTGGALVGAGNAPGGTAPLDYSTDIAGTAITTWDIGAFNFPDAAQFARPSSDVAGGTFRSILVTAPFGPRVIA